MITLVLKNDRGNYYIDNMFHIRNNLIRFNGIQYYFGRPFKVLYQINLNAVKSFK